MCAPLCAPSLAAPEDAAAERCSRGAVAPASRACGAVGFRVGGTIVVTSRPSTMFADADAIAGGAGTCEEPYVPARDRKTATFPGPGSYSNTLSVSDDEAVTVCGGASASVQASVSTTHDVVATGGGLAVSVAMNGSAHMSKQEPPVTDPFNLVAAGGEFDVRADLRVNYNVSGGPVTLTCDATSVTDDAADGSGGQGSVSIDGADHVEGHQEVVLEPGGHTLYLAVVDTGRTTNAHSVTNDSAVGLDAQCSAGSQVAVAITSGPSGTVPSRSAAFEFVALDASPPPGRFECRLDAGSFTSCTSPTTFSSLGEGGHTFDVRYHPDGEAAGVTTTRTWTVDTRAPVAAFDRVPAGDGNPAEATIEFHGDEPATFLCSLDSAPPSGCTSPVRLVGLSDGAHTFAVLPRDLAGNEGTTITAGWSVAGQSLGAPAAAPKTLPVAECGPGASAKAEAGPFVLVARSAASACFVERTVNGHRTQVSPGPVTWNGLLIRPAAGATIGLHREAGQGVVTISGASVLDLGAAGTWNLPRGLRFASSLAGSATKAFKLLDEVQGDVDATAFDLGGLPLAVSPSFEMSDAGGGQTTIGLKLALPTKVLATHDVFGIGAADKTQGLSAEFSAKASNAQGFTFAGKAGLDEAWLLGLLKLEDVELGFDSAGPSFEGAAAISFGAPVKAGKAKQLKLELALGPGGFFGLLRKASVSASNINAPIGTTPFFFQQIGAKGEAAGGGVKLAGDVGISGGPAIPLLGEALGLKGTLTLELPDTGAWSIEGKGEAEIAEVPVAESSLKYVNGEKVELAGKLDLSIAGTGLLAGIRDSWFTTTDFNVEGTGTLALFGTEENAEAVLSKSGYAVCIGDGDSRVGFGKRWGQSASVMGDACDLGPFRSAASAAQATGATAITVPAGRRIFAIEASAAGGPPKVTLTGPSGGAVASRALEDPARGSTTFVLRRPAAGTYRLAPVAGPGAAQSISVRTAQSRPPVKVRARVGGRGATRTLAWSLDPLPGQRVTFVERGPAGAKAIVTTGRRSGSVRFVPNRAAGSARRTIEARVTQNALPRRNVTVARYRFATSLQRVRGLRRAGARLTWKSQPAAAAYTVVLGQDGGTVTSTTVTRPRLPLAPALRRSRLRVAVYPLDAFQRSGPRTSVVLPASRR